MARLVAFGEVMLRLNPPGFDRLVATPVLEMSFGGAEANVAASAALFGMEAALVTRLPDNPIGEACIRALRSRGVDTSRIARGGSRIGIYFLEAGAVQRPSAVLYDRAGSAIAEVTPGTFDWPAILAGADWFHVTGITPAISRGAAEETLRAAQAACKAGLTVSCDLNYRKKLWKWGRTASEVMAEIMPFVHVAIANEEDAEQVFGIRAPGADVEAGRVEAAHYRHVAEEMMRRFPSLRKVAITLRTSLSASHNRWSGVLFDGSNLHRAREYDITHIVDRVGAGDSFGGGLIYALTAGRPDAEALEFAVAASCLKHAIRGDFNDVTVAEVEALMAGSGSGRVQR